MEGGKRKCLHCVKRLAWLDWLDFISEELINVLDNSPGLVFQRARSRHNRAPLDYIFGIHSTLMTSGRQQFMFSGQSKQGWTFCIFCFEKSPQGAWEAFALQRSRRNVTSCDKSRFFEHHSTRCRLSFADPVTLNSIIFWFIEHWFDERVGQLDKQRRRIAGEFWVITSESLCAFVWQESRAKKMTVFRVFWIFLIETSNEELWMK